MNIEVVKEKFKKLLEENSDVWQDGKEVTMPKNIELIENKNMIDKHSKEEKEKE